MFYPQLVAGPIERPQNLLHQFREKHDFDYARITSGLKLMMWGLFKKVVIAERLAVIVDHVYNNPDDHNGMAFIVATIFFSFQIFCDFSGYSDMAIGAARIMGFKLMRNFDKPYQSKSISEFWKRWHISLSSWFRDYLYISLGGNRVTIPRWYFNLFIVFLVSGLWHGANWTFIIWGALHGFYLVFAIVIKKPRDWVNTKLGLNKLPFLETITTFVLVGFAWIFFRAANLNTAFYVIRNLFSGVPQALKQMVHGQSWMPDLGVANGEVIFSVFLIILLEVIHALQNKIDFNKFLGERPVVFRWAVYYLVILSIMAFGVFQSRQFIYFQF